MRIIYLLFLFALLGSCAQVVRPTGGDKDITPPKIIESSPKNYSVNFSGNKITLEFDEFINVKSFYQQLVISPPLEEQPEYKVKGKKLELILPDSLLENTTYTINFGNGIIDITESNPLDSNLFVFSTGSYLDSLEVRGTVKAAFDLTTEKGILVMLYANQEDSVPRTLRPDYFTRTQEDGSFIIPFIKHGTYKVFALKDNNSNYLFDQPIEPIAFLEEPIDPSVQDTLGKSLYLFEEDSKQQYIVESKAVSKVQLSLIFNRKVDELELNPLNFNPGQNWFTEVASFNRDTFSFWLNDSLRIDTATVQVKADTLVDTVYFTQPRKRKAGKRGANKEISYNPSLNIKSGALPYFTPLKFTFNSPLASTKSDSVLFVEGADTIPFPNEQTSIAGIDQWLFDYPWKEGFDYSIIFQPGAFTSRYGVQSDSVIINFTTTKAASYGNFKLKLSMAKPDHQLILQLQDEKGRLIQENILTDLGTIKYENLSPKKYRLKLIYDRNSNGKWDTGKYEDQTQPESVIFYQELIEIRGNWELDVEWKVD